MSSFCFEIPFAGSPTEKPDQLLKNLVWSSKSAKRASEIMKAFADDIRLCGLLNNGLSILEKEGCARLLAALLCAEESAVNIFHIEGNRMHEKQEFDSERTLMEIASEERVHDWLIRRTRKFLPEPDDIDSIRLRSKRTFMRIASRELSTHFARIAGLDSGVCIILSALLNSQRITASEGLKYLLSHIRMDETGHVEKSLYHAIKLGFDKSELSNAINYSRQAVVKMLVPIRDAFEDLKVDSDSLFKRLIHQQDIEGSEF